MADDETTLREDLVVHYQKVDALGLNEMSSGNLSVRFGDKMLAPRRVLSLPSLFAVMSRRDVFVDISLVPTQLV